MAGPSDEAGEDSTPLSSPPRSFNYAFREDSYYTDDQSDGCFGGDHGATNAFTDTNESDTDEEFESDGPHEQHCTLHVDSLATHCNALTQTRQKCSRKAKVFTTGFYPVCGTHNRYWSMKKAGKCQAMEECGRMCGRLAPHSPPYHLCVKHEKGTSTLPCGIMELPTELLLMIFRYLFPKTVDKNGLCRHTGAVLSVNRTFHLAASSIVYNELEFEAHIDRSYIKFLGRTWNTNGDDKYSDINKALCQAGAQRIRKLCVDVRFAISHFKIKGIGSFGLSAEDYELYQVRDTVQKFVDMLSPATEDQSATNHSSLKQVEVRPAPGLSYNWQSDEAVAAIFFVVEPFVALGPIETPALLHCPRPAAWHSRIQLLADTIGNIHKDEAYRRLRKIWLRFMRDKLSTPNHVRRGGKSEILITREYKKIEELQALIHKHELATNTKHGWMSSSFQGIERALHIARIINANVCNGASGDLERMGQIREAITKRWVNAHRQQQRSISAIATCISSMYHSSSEDPTKSYPDAFEVETLDLIETNKPVDVAWRELGQPDNAPGLMERGVTYTEDSFRIHIRKGDEECTRLKTPSMVRQLRMLKRR
ncbi:hypothetical protein C7974DRAFT_333282 [Boeremia exigua]|uniref:uncharacterized protein n=1 Tax=Boeremia exigua TaxID=749465 RepID=UPI001E8EB835|nr:uncharacterized protein C7974DRAFT_333282 [Boeremia exigua]KAH6638278.1 hypothetical protein C7974DRAFT_333282 [Boeremia exigua]